ncbi:hypothetical protein BH10PLA1_BH10PLA1_09170 [soil metagenome]
MIRAVAWFCADHYGLYAPQRMSFARPAPKPDELLTIIGRPVKYFSRMTAETKASLCAASLALRDFAPDVSQLPEVGMLAAGDEGCISANQNYFRDYVSGGRSMGRGNLFIYTLPTSTLGEMAIALSLNGPTMYVHADQAPLATLMHQSRQLVADREADAILALWSGATASVCMVVQRELPGSPSITLPPDASPLELANAFHSRVTCKATAE